MSTSLIIATDKEKIYNSVANLREWLRWSPTDDPSLNYTYQGRGGAGAQRFWANQREITSYLMLLKSNDKEDIIYYSFSVNKGCIDSSVTGEIALEEITPNNTKVVWSERGDISKSLLLKWMYVLLGPILHGGPNGGWIERPEENC